MRAKNLGGLISVLQDLSERLGCETPICVDVSHGVGVQVVDDFGVLCMTCVTLILSGGPLRELLREESRQARLEVAGDA